jgi:hypothetical protein
MTTLMQLIGQNQANPKFQQSILGYYLDSMNPINHPDPFTATKTILTESNVNEPGRRLSGENFPTLALSLLSSDNKELQDMV